MARCAICSNDVEYACVLQICELYEMDARNYTKRMELFGQVHVEDKLAPVVPTPMFFTSLVCWVS